jgi:hypothetical protein
MRVEAIAGPFPKESAMSSQNRIGLTLVLIVILSAAVILFSGNTGASDETVEPVARAVESH